MDASERGRLIMKLAQLIKRDKDLLVNLEVADVGKPITEAQGDIDAVIATFEYFAGWADKIHGRTIPAGTIHFQRFILAFFPFIRWRTFCIHKKRTSWCLWPNHSMELSIVDAVMEMGASISLWMHGCNEAC